jgi:hypothetical protein
MAAGDRTLHTDSGSMGRSPDSKLGLAITIGQYRPCRFATVLCHWCDRAFIGKNGDCGYKASGYPNDLIHNYATALIVTFPPSIARICKS